jgi:cellulose synthase/poly-beta-1,6-N-acetylglucosamine synthase-like glycosyltransferase
MALHLPFSQAPAEFSRKPLSAAYSLPFQRRSSCLRRPSDTYECRPVESPLFREVASLNRSLSALLPVRNVESQLTPMVLEMLEILPELTNCVELVVIDDGSTDATIEVADELCGRYPQLRAVGHTRPQGRAAAIATGLARSNGQAIFLPDEEGLLAVADLQKMWGALDDHELVLGRARPGRATAPWTRRSVNHRGGFVLGYRAVVEAIRPLLIDQLALRSHLLRHNYRWDELEIAARRSPPAPHRVGRWSKPPLARRIGAAHSGHYAGVIAAPNYLTRLCDFAFGE